MLVALWVSNQVADTGETRLDASVITERNSDSGLVEDGTEMDRTCSFRRYVGCRKDKFAC